MLRLPDKIIVQLRDLDDQILAISNVLLGINILHEGRYYYGCLAGLTDESGRALVDREAVEHQYAIDRACFPSDYRIELSECDPETEFVILDEESVSLVCSQVGHDYSLQPEIRVVYQAARNELVSPSLVRMEFKGRQTVIISINTQRREGR